MAETNTTICDYFHIMTDVFRCIRHVTSLIYELLSTSPILALFLAVGMILCALLVYVICGRDHVTSGDVSGAGNDAVVPRSVNYHFTRQCNYKCGFCFHTAKTSHLLELEEAKRGLRLLKQAGQITMMMMMLPGCFFLSFC